MNNIPEGYDENGVRAGNGQWDVFEFEGGEASEELDVVTCFNCGCAIEVSDSINYEDEDFCLNCVMELGFSK